MVANKLWIAVCNALLKSYRHFHKTTMASLLVPPESVRGMTQLDRDAFTIIMQVQCVKIDNDGNSISQFISILKKYLLKIRNFKPVQVRDDCFTVFLDPAIVRTIDDIAEKDKSALENKYKYFGETELKLTYDNWKTEELLKAILPVDVEIPVSFSHVGHILHLNLRDAHFPYKYIIGQIYLDTVPHVKTVVNKLDIIETEFRNFKMEILAGEDNTITTVKEHGLFYQFDFAKVYWNPRLSTEHQNLVSRLAPGDVLYDVFAGVGPFTIPAARKKVTVLANDLNPESYKWLNTNVALNKVTKTVKCFNMDGRDFLKNVVSRDILERRKRNASGSEHIVMNLPALAVEFLDVLPKCFATKEVSDVCGKSPPPVIHVYTFVKANKGEDPCTLAKTLVEKKLECALSPSSYVDVHYVRKVAPNKEMIRVSFVLEEYILRSEEPATKRSKMQELSDNSKDFHILDSKSGQQQQQQQQQIERPLQHGEKEQSFKQDKKRLSSINDEERQTKS